MVKICYNFSAIEQHVAVAREVQPIILDRFTSAITTYDCEYVEGGLNVPHANPAPEVQKLMAGRTKAQVATLLGVDGLYVASPTEWWWNFRTGPKGPCQVDKVETSRDCTVHFDEAGTVESFENVGEWAIVKP